MSFSNFYGPVADEVPQDILSNALDLGIDHIDTANVYGMGHSEQVIGEYLAKNHPNGPCPFTIATKAAINRDPETGERSFNNTAAHLEAELDKSLSRLGLEVVDLFYVHRRDPNVPIEEVTETLAQLIKTGKILSFGYSEIAPSSLRRAAAVHDVAAVQSEYSLATRSPEMGLVQTCEELGTAMVAFSPVSRGLLTDVAVNEQRLADSAFLRGAPRFSEPNLSANIAATDKLRAIAADMGTSASSLAIAWLMNSSPNVISIPGTRSVEHLRQLAAGAELNLSAEDISRIEAALPIGWAHGDRYNEVQWVGPERYC
jgi:aryl-alcohol dehydrogenase-like predicted oxidoreductase